MWKFLFGAAVALAAAFLFTRLDDLNNTAGALPAPGGSGAKSEGWIGDADALRAHLQFLSDDLLEGREAGTRGYDVAALYAANYFASLGLEPAGGDGSYLQTVPLLTSQRDYSAAEMALIRAGVTAPLVSNEDFRINGSYAHKESDVRAPMVFVGWGVEAPAFGVNSYDSVDVDGKIVIALFGGPPTLPAEERAHFGSFATKMSLAASKGAVGFVILYTPALEEMFSFERAVELGGRTSMTWLENNGAAHEAFPQLRASAMVSLKAAPRLFDGAAMSYADVLDAIEAEEEISSFDLAGELFMKQRSVHGRTSSANVAAVLEGSDPDIKDEYVVYTAHLDHDGVHGEAGGDTIYNGAIDNASGSAIVLDLARAFAEAEERPRRSIMFLLVTAEEKGLRGAGYFAHHPTVPIENVAAAINVDCVLMFFDFAEIIAFGDTHSTLKDHVAKAADAMGLGVMADPYPEQGFFTRSDHYRFVQQGVPSLFTFLGFAGTGGSSAGEEALQTYLAENYHQPSDDLSQPFDYDAGAKFVEFQYRVGASVADAENRPRWNDGDFFGELYGREENRPSPGPQSGRF